VKRSLEEGGRRKVAGGKGVNHYLQFMRGTYKWLMGMKGWSMRNET
jgi:hypothetical protein